MSLNAVRLVNSILASSIHFRAQWFNEASQLISWIESIITDTFSNFDTQKFGIMNWKTSNSWICKKRMYSNLCIRKESIFASPHGVMAQLIPNVPIPPPPPSICRALVKLCFPAVGHRFASKITRAEEISHILYHLLKRKTWKLSVRILPKKALFFTKSSTVVVLMIKSRNFEVLPLACKVDIGEFHASLKTPVPRVKEVILIPYLIIGVFVFFMWFWFAVFTWKTIFCTGCSGQNCFHCGNISSSSGTVSAAGKLLQALNTCSTRA